MPPRGVASAIHGGMGGRGAPAPRRDNPGKPPEDLGNPQVFIENPDSRWKALGPGHKASAGTEQTELIPGDAFPPDAFGTMPERARPAREVSYTKSTSANALVTTRSPQKTQNVSKSSPDFPENFRNTRSLSRNPLRKQLASNVCQR